MRLDIHRSFVAAALCAIALAAPRPGHAILGLGLTQPEPPAPVAAVGSVERPASCQALGKGAWIPLTQGQKVSASDIVKTEGGGKAVIAFSDGTKVQLGENANFQVDSLEAKKVSLRLSVGLLDAWVAKVKKRRFQIRTPTAVAAVRGTQIKINVAPNGNTEFFCFSGSIEVAPPSGIGRAVEVQAGQTVAAPAGGKVSDPLPVPPSVTPPVEPAVAIPAPAPALTPGAEEGKAPPEVTPEPTPELGLPRPNPVQERAVSGSPPLPDPIDDQPVSGSTP